MRRTSTLVLSAEKVLLVHQVDDFALGCRQESTAKSVYSDIGAKLTLHNEAEAPFEYLGLVDSADGYDVLETRDYIKLSAESYIRPIEGSWLGLLE